LHERIEATEKAAKAFEERVEQERQNRGIKHNTAIKPRSEDAAT